MELVLQTKNDYFESMFVKIYQIHGEKELVNIKKKNKYESVLY